MIRNPDFADVNQSSVSALGRNFARSTMGWLAFATAFALGSFLVTNSAFGAVLEAGDIVAVTQSSGGVYVVDSRTGSIEQVSLGGLLNNPFHVLIEDSRRLLIPERTGGNPGSGIVRLDLLTGNQSLLSSIDFPLSITFDPSGDLIAGNFDEELYRIDPRTGATSFVAKIPDVFHIQDIDIDSDGQWVILSPRKVTRFDPTTGQHSTVALGAFTSDLVIHDSGDYIVASDNQLFRIDPVSGVRQVELTASTEFRWLALQSQNSLVYSDSAQIIRRRNLETGHSQILADFSGFRPITGIAVTAIPEPNIAVFIGIGFSLLLLSPRWRRPKATLAH